MCFSFHIKNRNLTMWFTTYFKNIRCPYYVFFSMILIAFLFASTLPLFLLAYQPHSEANDNNTSALLTDENITSNIIDNNDNTVNETQNVRNQDHNTSDVVIRRSLSTKGNNEAGFITRIFITITQPWLKFLSIPKISDVIKNIGTCIVNGIMEIIAHYCPSPLMPLVASAAGMLIPFEPVVTLKRKNPVESYRRAFNSAVDSFLGAFDTYKHNDDDPYMQKRFLRRFMKEPNHKKMHKMSEQTLNEY